jgi:glycosyltransferase involved in cell wall biosynthesis
MPALPDVAVSDLPPASGPRLRLQLLGISNTYPPLITGGYGEICADVMETLRRRGHGVTMLVCDQSYAPLPGDDQSHVRRWLAYVLAPWRHPLKGLRAASRNDRATRSVLEQGFDAVLAWHCRGVSKNVLRRCHEQGVPVLYFLHDRWVLYERPGALLLPWARLDRWGARLPREILGSSIARRVELRAPRIDRDGVLCYVSDWLQDEHHRRGFVGRTETKVPCGVRIRPHAQRVAGVSPRRLLFAGRIEPRKGLAVAVEALAACPEDTTISDTSAR